jgi:RimJ/RimL family protein N-acetyltransferase
VRLRPARGADRRRIYDWLARSDLTPVLLGGDRAHLTWAAFCRDYRRHYFDGSRPLSGRCFVIQADGADIGQVNYNDIDRRGRSVELDIWLRSAWYCGRGYGTDALETLCEHLRRTFGVRRFLVNPSAPNGRAIRAYQKAGFAMCEQPGLAAAPGTVWMVKVLE